MKVNAQLYGSIGRKIPNYDHSVGVDLELEDGATVTDVLKLVNVPNVGLAVVLREGNILKKDEGLFDGNKIVVLETMTGG